MMIVEAVGFLRVLSYIELLVKASRQRIALVRKLEILWQDDVFAGRSSFATFRTSTDDHEITQPR